MIIQDLESRIQPFIPAIVSGTALGLNFLEVINGIITLVVIIISGIAATKSLKKTNMEINKLKREEDEFNKNKNEK